MDTGVNVLKSKYCWDSSGVNFKMLFDLILELQFAVTSVLQPSMAVEPDKNHDSRRTADGKFDEILKLQIESEPSLKLCLSDYVVFLYRISFLKLY